MLKKIMKAFCHLTLLFLLGAIFGFILEVTWYFLKHGVLINKQGLLYGPFKPIYGLGLVLITFLLHKIDSKNICKLFLWGFVIGTIFEYFCSYFQEIAFNTYTWSYASFNLNLNGRIYLPYCLFWGGISSFWMHYLYPKYLKLFNKYINNGKEIIVIIIGFLLILDGSLTFFALKRANERKKCSENISVFEEFLDQKYNDEILAKKFPKMRYYEE